MSLEFVSFQFFNVDNLTGDGIDANNILLMPLY